jgi:c(7)-type cytochrome triheme protein
VTRRTGAELLRRAALAALAAASLAMKPPAPAPYGRVLLESTSRTAGVPPVAFDHWKHRSRYTCRLCHVDVGFAMTAGATGITAETNRSRFHCGACHNGETRHGGRAIFASCSSGREMTDTCRRCHARPDPARLAREWEAFAADLPRTLGGGVDWEVAEARGDVTPADVVDGASLRRPALRMDRDVEIGSQVSWMSAVRFSHKKHAVWNGCEVCHPEIYPSTAGAVRHNMLEISSGASCGVCHDKVAFPLALCERCHVRPVR